MEKKIYTVAVVAFFAAFLIVHAGQSPTVLRNGSFEASEKGKPTGWTLPAYYSLAPGMGRNGSTAIAYSFVTNRQYLAPVAQGVKLEPGESYRIACWVRTEGVKQPKGAPAAKIGLEWKNASGRYDGTYSKQLHGTKDWTKLEFISPQMPEGISSARVQVYVGYGKTEGKAWFDDVSVEKIQTRPIYGLYADAYRGTVSGKEPLGLVAHTRISKQLLMDGKASAVLHYRDSNGKGRTAEPTAITPERAMFSLSADSLSAGTQTVVCVVSTNGIEAGRAECSIVNAATPPKWPVRFDRHGRTLVDGKPFFPLGMYMGKVTPEELAVYREGSFNCLMPYSEPSREMLDLAVAKNLRVIYPLKEVYSHTGWAKSRKIRTVADEEAYVAKRVAEFKDHPAILAWYLNDEFGPEYAGILATRRALFERLDPGHPTWNCLYQVNQLYLYMDSIDCIGTDPYPISRRSPSMANDWTILTRRNTFGCRPIWMIPQAMSWAWFKSGSEKDRMPTADEMRTMSWQMIASGANGLVYYAFHQMRRNAGADFARDWTAVRTVAAEIARHSDILVADPGPAAKANIAPDFMPVRTWRRAGDVFLLAVNASGKQVEAVISVEGSHAECSTVFGTSTCNLCKDGGVAASLPPWAVLLVKLNR